VKKLIVLLILLVLVGGGIFAYFRFFYLPKPEDAYLRTVACATLGDEECFLAGFTDASRPLVAGLLSLARGEDPRSRKHPYFHIVTEEVESVDVEDDRAWLRVRRPGDKDLRSAYDIPLVKEKNAWKIDALAFTGAQRQVTKVR